MKETLEFNGATEESEQIIGQADAQYKLFDIPKLSKEYRKIFLENVDKKKMASLVDIFYQTQRRRIAVGNQISAIKKENDYATEDTIKVFQWLHENLMIEEKQIFSIFKDYQKLSPTGRWLTEVKGIGPTYAVVLMSFLDITGKKAAGQFHSICGLNDNNVPWLGKEKAKKMVNEVVGTSKKITEEMIFLLAERSGRTPSKIEYFSYERDGKTKELILDKAGKPKQSKTALIKGLSLLPYNAFLKKTCWLIADSFVKNRNRGSLYGQLYFNRKFIETKKNEEKAFAEQAARALEENHFTKKEVIECYKSGMLPPGHIEARARRYAVKLFISHLFEQMWIEYHQTNPPEPYILEYSPEFDHNGYIEPEVPYIWK